MNNYIKRKLVNNNKFEYYTKNNIKITDNKILEKIKKIYIAPAYTNVKIYLDQNVLATGYDKKGRKQYVYSNKMKEKREKKKIKKLKIMSKNIGKLKNKIKKDLSQKTFNKDKLSALVIKIMDLCNFRNGNKKYEKLYKSYGLTTLHRNHLKIRDNEIEINFVGKKGVVNNCIIQNKYIQDIIKKVYKLSSKNNDSYLFSIRYNNEDIKVSKEDINNYLKEFNVTTKDLRTWNANIIFLKNLQKEIDKTDFTKYNEKNENFKIKFRKKLMKEAIIHTAESLHHTPSICKSSYILKMILSKIETNGMYLTKIKKNENVENLLDSFIKNL